MRDLKSEGEREIKFGGKKRKITTIIAIVKIQRTIPICRFKNRLRYNSDLNIRCMLMIK